ncbi:MAG: hypothetical protein GF350_02980 [Chitinivibrionales bacterium]|nr:hypothetical protein [Chitinivibrionales bacterium]
MPVIPDDKIREYFAPGCEVKALGRGHIQRIKRGIAKKNIARPRRDICRRNRLIPPQSTGKKEDLNHA